MPSARVTPSTPTPSGKCTLPSGRAVAKAIQAMLATRAGEAAAEPAALPAPEAQSIGAGLEPKRQRRPNRLLMQADTAVGPRERKPRKREGGEDE